MAVSVCALLQDNRYSQQLAQLCAAQGWQIRYWDSRGTDQLPALEPVDLILFDDAERYPQLAAELDHWQRSVFVWVSETPEQQLDSVTSIGPWCDEKHTIDVLTNALNAARFTQQFFTASVAEPITKLPHHPELLAQMASKRGAPMTLLVVQVDHTEHLYANLDPVSKTDVLSALASHLQAALPHQCLMGIYDAGCFAVWIPTADQRLVKQAELALLHAGKHPVVYKDGELHFTLSIGHANIPNLDNPQWLWQQAWRAKEEARHAGGACLVRAAVGYELQDRLPDALAHNEFSLVLQPQFDIDGQQLRGVETLLRWQGMDMGELSADQFIPMAERSGHMTRIGDWVLERACCESATWLAHVVDPILIGVNVSAQQFANAAILHQVQRLVHDSWLNPSVLELELSHDSLLHVIDQHRSTLYQLRDFGVRIAIDQLGRDVIDAQRLLRCPADTLKIDRHLIQALENDANARKLAEQICQLANQFELRVVAVGVETPAQRDILRDMGCMDAQGYLYAQPIALEHFHQFLSADREMKYSS